MKKGVVLEIKKSFLFIFKKGQTLVEYAFILAFITLGAVILLQGMGTWVKSKFSQVSSGLEG